MHRLMSIQLYIYFMEEVFFRYKKDTPGIVFLPPIFTGYARMPSSVATNLPL